MHHSPSLVVMRRLRRPHKTRAALRQLGLCAFCARALPEAFEVDHLMRAVPRDDRPANLAACCGTCHNHKSMCERESRERDVEAMVAGARRRKQRGRARMSRLQDASQRNQAFERLPRWLRERPGAHEAWLRACGAARAVRAPPHMWQQYRYLSAAPAAGDAVRR